MRLMDGKAVATTLQEKMKLKVSTLLNEGKKVPHLAAILVGEDGASHTYVAAKVKNCNDIGFGSTLIQFKSSVAENELEKTIQRLNADTAIDGILVQLPLPEHISEKRIINLVDPSKDVDGFNSENVGKMVQGF